MQKTYGGWSPKRSWSQSLTFSLDRARQVAAELEIELSYGSLEAMLECKDLDAVLIATPDKFHAQAVVVAARAGKSILCEKPLALNLADARGALEAVSKAGVRLQIGFMRRYDPAYSAAMKRIDAGEIGVPVIFKSVGRDKDEPPISAYQSNLNGMVFYNNTIHDFDLARWLMQDEVAEVPLLHDGGDPARGCALRRCGRERRQSSIPARRNWQRRILFAGGLRIRRTHGDRRLEGFHSCWQSSTRSCHLPHAAGGTHILADHFLTRFRTLIWRRSAILFKTF